MNLHLSFQIFLHTNEFVSPFPQKDLFKNHTVIEVKNLWEQIKQEVSENIHRKTACKNAKYLSLCADEIVKQVFFYISQTYPQSFAILAIGGYGRGMLAPYSDLDLVFVADSEDKETHDYIQQALYILWDLKFEIGYSVLTPSELQEKYKNDLDFCTAFLDRRLLLGNYSLYEALSLEYKNYQTDSALRFLDAKLLERETRHKKTGDSRYLVEPDLKNGKGGLRDIHSLHWIGRYLYEDETVIFSPADIRLMEKAENFLWAVRIALHHHSKKATEKLSFDVQKQLAEFLGYKDQKGRIAAEYFMKHYFTVARYIGHLTRIFCHALEVKHHLRIKNTQILTLTLEDEKEFHILEGRVAFREQTATKENPFLMIKIFEIADRYNLRMHPNSLRAIHNDMHLIQKKLRNCSKSHKSFRQILCRGKHTEKTLRDMNEMGVLGLLIPDFGRIVGLMQFNMYHHYTVDEHLIRCVGVMHDIAYGNLRYFHPLASQIIHTIEMHDVLFLSAFLHDIAKGRPEDHSIAGGEVAEELGTKMGFSSSEISVLKWLVIYHLKMSDTSQKRDVHDPEIAKEFGSFVQSVQRLKLLLCLTVADIQAVGKNVWNGWKGELLRKLYYNTQEYLGQGSIHEYKRKKIDYHKCNFIKEISDETLLKHIEKLPDNCWLCEDISWQKSSLQLIENFENNGNLVEIDFSPDEFCDITNVTIYTYDYQGLFTSLTGALGASGVSIYGAKIYTSIAGFALDSFQIQDISHKSITDKSYLERIQNNIIKAVAQRKTDFSDIKQKQRKQIKKIFSIPSYVVFDNNASKTDTVIEIETLNRPFLLYEIARLLHNCQISISSAHINSYGEKAVDVFYVRDKFGFKIEAKNYLNGLREKILNILNI